jgi:hypothetical protein
MPLGNSNEKTVKLPALASDSCSHKLKMTVAMISDFERQRRRDTILLRNEPKRPFYVYRIPQASVDIDTADAVKKSVAIA